MDSRVDELSKRSGKLFGQRSTLMSLWQEQADNFYPQRADFTVKRTIGDEFASNLMTSYPILVHRDLSNSFSAMLRPAGKEWFFMTTENDDQLDYAAKAWLQESTSILRRAMYDRRSGFVRATKEGDADFAAFGNAVVSVELNQARDGLLYRCWHLRDVAWAEDEGEGHALVSHRWKPTAGYLVSRFGDRVSPKTRALAQQDPMCEVPCSRAVILSSQYNNSKFQRFPFVSVYWEDDPGHVLEEIGLRSHPYVIPRWQTVSGSQYGYSPATVAALPDARLLQSMTAVLLDAGEKAVDPPIIGVKQAVRGDVNVFAGGITWVDGEYEGQARNAALRELSRDKSGIPLGLEMNQDTRAMLASAFFLDRITLPPPDREMTAYEVGQRMSEYIRQVLPLFEPMESDYNGALCERSADVLLHEGGFGPVSEIPPALAGADVKFKFQTPLQAAMDSQKAALLQQAQAMLASVGQADPGSLYVVDVPAALRDALDGIRVPAKWMRSEEQVQAILQRQQEQANAQQMLAALDQGSQIAERMGKAQAMMPGV